jgi:hypothetical protein
VCRQGAEAEVAGFRAEQAPRQAQGVEAAIGQAAVAVGLGGGVEVTHVVAHVVTDDHGVTDELEQDRKRLGQLGGTDQHVVGDPGEDRDRRGNRKTGIDQGVKGALHLAPT